MKYCRNCGAPLEEGTRFCPSCGTPTGGVLPAPEPQPEASSPGDRRRRRRKPLLQRVWFWLLLIVAAAIVLPRLKRASPAAPRQTERTLSASVSPSPTQRPPATPKPTVKPTAKPTATPAPKSGAAESGIRPEFREFMDSYEAIMTEYAEITERLLNEDGEDYFSLLMDYYRILEEYEAFEEAFEDIDEEDLTDEELAYYLEVNLRLTQLFLDSAG